MPTEKISTERSLAAHLKPAHRCSVCGREMTTLQSILSLDGTGFCDACYRDSFFDEMGTDRRRVLDHCEA